MLTMSFQTADHNPLEGCENNLVAPDQQFFNETEHKGKEKNTKNIPHSTLCETSVLVLYVCGSVLGFTITIFFLIFSEPLIPDGLK